MKNLVFVFLLLINFSFAKEFKMVIMGDSLTEGYGLDPAVAYPAQLEKLLKKDYPNIVIVPSGISGSTTASGMKRFEWLSKQQIDLFVVELGANDILRGIDPVTTEKNLRDILTAAKNKKIPTMLMDMKVPTNYGVGRVKKYEHIFPTLAKEFSVPLVPFLLQDVAGKKELNLADGIHPNPKGHEVVAKTLYEFFKGELKKYQL